ncbi:MAG: flavin reductase [Clostridiaceae bacterium]|nr:flavin reductase [Clostridiaceae bacterium]
MSKYEEIKPEELNKSPFQLIGKDWMLIAAQKDSKVNAMTASWGGFGVIWGKNVVYIVLRPQRYTKEFVDSSDTFSISFLGNDYKKQLSYLGSVSGRDEDKIVNSKLTVSHMDDTPYFEEGKTVLICKKLYAQEFKPECFVTSGLEMQKF